MYIYMITEKVLKKYTCEKRNAHLLHEFQNVFKRAVLVSVPLELGADVPHDLVLLLKPPELLRGQGLLIATQPVWVLHTHTHARAHTENINT